MYFIFYFIYNNHINQFINLINQNKLMNPQEQPKLNPK
jgi:hypothetical protein